jgi:hypothetical protein
VLLGNPFLRFDLTPLETAYPKRQNNVRSGTSYQRIAHVAALVLELHIGDSQSVLRWLRLLAEGSRAHDASQGGVHERPGPAEHSGFSKDPRE